MSDRSCDVVIVNYNAGGHLGACVGSVLAEGAASVIVVDNRSEDASLGRLIAEYGGHPALRVIRNEANLGFAAACNIGVDASRSPLILFLNPDAFLAPGTLGRLVDVLLRSEAVGMAGGYLCYPDGSEQAGGRRAIPTPRRSLMRTLGLSRFEARWPGCFSSGQLHLTPLPERPTEVEAISGACMLMRRHALNEVGRWDEDYFLHCEDLDLAMRFRERGWKILFIPDAPVVHAHGACSANRRLFVEWHKHRGMVRFYRKFFGHYPSPLRALINFGIGVRFILVAGRHCLGRLGASLRARHE